MSTLKPLEALAFAQRLLQRTNPEALDATVHQALDLVGSASNADRACIFMIEDTVFVKNTHEWAMPGIAGVRPEAKETHYDEGDIFWRAFKRHGIFCLPEIDALPPDSDFRALLVLQGVKSQIAAPIYSDANRTAGFIVLDFCKTYRQFSAEDEAILHSFAASLSAAFENTRLLREKLRLEGKLAGARAHIAAMLTTLPELLIETDADGYVVGFHQSQPMTLAISPEEVIGQPPEGVLPPHAARVCRKAMAQVDEKGWSERLGYSLQIGESKKRYSLHATSRGSGGKQTLQGYLFIIRDVTESHRQDTQVRQLGRLSQLSSNLIMLTDAERKLIWMNPACADRTGVSVEEAIGQCPLELLRLPEVSCEIAERMNAALDRGEVIEEEVRVYCHNGLPYWLKLNIQCLRNEDGQIESYTVLGNDITVQKMAEARALRQSSKLLDASSEGIAISSADGRLNYINPTLRALLDVPFDMPAEDMRWTELCGDGCKAQLEAIAQALEEKGHWQGEIPFPDAKMPKYHFDASIALQDDGSVLTIVRDVSTRKAAEREMALLREQLQIAQSRKLVAQLASAVAHDLVNLLSVIGMTADSIKAGTEPSTRVGLRTIEEATRDALSLVSAMSRLGARTPYRTRLDLCRSIGQAADLVRPSLSSDIRLSLNLPDGDVSVIGDRTELMQVLINLLVNARDAIGAESERDGEILLRLRGPEPPSQGLRADIGEFQSQRAYYCIEVEDDGIGIDPEVKDRIFEPHFSTKGEQGSGLGLSIVADIVAANGAALRVVNKSEGGCCVSVYWPTQGEQTQCNKLSGLRVLLVELDAANLSGLSQTLSGSNAEVTFCSKLDEAHEVVCSEKDEWDAVVVDWASAHLPQAHLMQRINASLPTFVICSKDILHKVKDSVHSCPGNGVKITCSMPELMGHLEAIHPCRSDPKD